MSARNLAWIDSMPVDAGARAAFLRCEEGLQDLVRERGRVTNSAQVIGRIKWFGKERRPHGDWAPGGWWGAGRSTAEPVEQPVEEHARSRSPRSRGETVLVCLVTMCSLFVKV